MPHEKLGLDCHTIYQLFPFHLLFSLDNDRRMLSVGSALQRVLPDDYLNCSFEDLFRITRPAIATLTTDKIRRYSDSIIFISIVGTDIVLRGQLLSNDPDVVIFLGTLLVSAADTIDTAGFNLADFPPFDTTPEIVILHRFRQIQIKGMEQQNLKLQKVIEARDTFDKYANTDSLTGIANRRGFWNYGTQWLQKNRRSTIAVLVMDIDRFKAINDNYGHEAGDVVLQVISSRLNDIMHEDGLAGRLGGDEFVAIVQAADEEKLHHRIGEIMTMAATPVLYNGNILTSSLSTGVIIADDDMGLDELIACADIAMYQGRSVGVGKISWYTSDIREKIEYNKRLTQDLERAIGDREIKPHFQPIVRLNDLELVSFEALARWIHPDNGFIGPDVFIGLAQKAGLLRQLDTLMLESSLDQLAVWHRQGKKYSMHVNICGASIHPELPELVRNNLAKRGLAASSLVLELTETTLIENTPETKAILNELTESGVCLHLDDFGTGYSSLTHLQDFPVTGVKIDRSFVACADSCKKASNLLFAIADIANHLDLEVVGEGIETGEQLRLLNTIGCQYGQGYLLGKPSGAEYCEELSIELAQKAA